jgi:hypothetical protein
MDGARCLIVAVLAVLAACAQTQSSRVQLPGETATSGLQVPPDLGERPTQVASAPTAR